MPDLKSRIKVVELFDGGTLAADKTANVIDRIGYRSCVLAIGIGAGGITFSGTNKVEFPFVHSDDNSTYTAVTDDDVDGITGIESGIIKSLTAAHASREVLKLGYIGSKRYLKANPDFSGTHGTGTDIYGIAILGDPLSAPVA